MRMLLAAAALAVSLPAAALKITSPAFSPGASIPPRFTCEGNDVSPPLAFSGVPKGTRTLVLIVTDPDAPDPAAPETTFTHWILYEIPPGTHGLSEAGDPQLPSGTRAGTNDFGKTRWEGPCPPVGRHRYVFRLYAIDTALGDLHEPSRDALQKAMEGHVIGEAALVGLYTKRAVQ